MKKQLKIPLFLRRPSGEKISMTDRRTYVDGLLSSWRRAISENSIYAFGLSKLFHPGRTLFRPPFTVGEREMFKGVFDNRRELHGTIQGALPVLSPELIPQTEGKIVIVAQDYQGIKKQLPACGLKEYEDFLWLDAFLSLYNYFVDNRLYHCGQAWFAEPSDMLPSGEGDYLDLSSLDPANRAEFLRFYLGLGDKGYVDLCRQCRGIDPVYWRPAPKGLQMPARKAGWPGPGRESGARPGER